MSTAPTNAHTHIHHTHIHHTNTQIIIRGLRQSLALAVAKLNDLSIVTTDAGGKQAVREVLEKCAGTALNSKLIAQQKARALFVCVWGGGRWGGCRWMVGGGYMRICATTPRHDDGVNAAPNNNAPMIQTHTMHPPMYIRMHVD